MRARTLPPRPRVQIAPRDVTLLLLVASLLAACGGGGGGPVVDPDAPAALTYESPSAVYRTDGPIAPNLPSWSGGDPTQWDCTPPLPAGLALMGDGSIVGTPTAPAPLGQHIVTASNAAGQTQATLTVQVLWHESKSLLPKQGLDDDDLRHFLDRTHFGFSQPHYDALVQLGLPAYVDAMTTFADTTQLETDAHNAYLVDVDDPTGKFPSFTDLARWWLYMVMANANPFQEHLALHWHNHFAASSTVLQNANTHYFIDHVNLWRHGGAGDLRTLLLDMARDPTMLVWLDGISNVDGQPNENFGREFFELFCLGVDIEYTQTDIVEAARAFTGYRQRFNSATNQSYIEFDPARHDHTAKTVLGQTIPAQTPGAGEVDEYDQMVDIVLSTNEPGTGVSRVGQWILRSLLEDYCYANPPQNVIDELANDLRSGGWQLKPVLMKLFQSEAFFWSKGTEGFVKGPVHHITGFMRATGLVADPSQIDRRLEAMGHRPTQPPTVDGWPGGTQWLSAQGMVDRANILNYVTEQSETLQTNLGLTALALLPAPDANGAATVDALSQRLRVTLSAAERTTLVTYLDTERNNAGTVTPSPFDPQGDPPEAERRVRGLLWILGQHPTYQTR